MKANELRIGNYVNTPRADQSPFRIDLIEFASKNNIKVGMSFHKLPHPFNENEFIDAHPLTWELQDLKPIKLTEEILLKYGFEYDDAFYYKDGIFLEYDDNSLRVDCMSDSVSVKYLHQLQNLYYALTGEELEINL